MFKPVIAAAAMLTLAACQDDPNMSGPTVKLFYPSGHGSATHIGGGFFVTAAHVIQDTGVPMLRDDKGREAEATVLWVNKEYDVALVRSSAPDVAAAHLDCRTANTGDEVTLRGNPMNLEHVVTYGRVSGDARELGPWANVLPVNAAIAGGMSGGGLFDDDGDFIGVNVGVMVMPIGFAGGPVAIGYSVPSSTVCMLMGRE